MTSLSDLAVVICHGSYHSPEFYLPLVNALKSREIEAVCPQLPTADLSKLNVGDVVNPDFDRGAPAGGYPQGEEDCEAVWKALEPLVNQGKRVILLAHSSGGWVATEAARPEWEEKSRKAKGLTGGIVGILYVGAFIIPVGESVNSFFQPKDGSFVVPPFMQFHKHGAAGLGTVVNAEKFLFNDLDEADAKKWTSLLTASPILTSKITNNAYEAVPCAYLVLDGDLTLDKTYQEAMAMAQGEKTGNFTIYHCPAGHSPHLSWTSGVVETVEDFAAKVMG
ncbi:alpha/beta-hydrolase [Periconia macrospinosa]|uniref:Alpha/beta-hydrolase n=1 Tax=Periconia macrospinosa TaxID=97972 RepID=A0A2V1DEN1_9PLEO|nr:alpha/beta-hydrolase [Periconia macrospinosa]